MDFVLRYGDVFDHIVLQLFIRLAGLLILQQSVCIGVAQLSHLCGDRRIQLVTGQLRIGEIVGFHTVQITVIGFIYRGLHFADLFIRKLVKTQFGNFLVDHGLLNQRVDSRILCIGDVIRIGRVVGVAVHAVEIRLITQRIFNGLLYFRLGDRLSCNFDNGGLGIHFRILNNEAATRAQHQCRDHQNRQKYTLAHGRSPLIIPI